MNKEREALVRGEGGSMTLRIVFTSVCCQHNTTIAADKGSLGHGLREARVLSLCIWSIKRTFQLVKMAPTFSLIILRPHLVVVGKLARWNGGGFSSFFASCEI